MDSGFCVRVSCQFPVHSLIFEERTGLKIRFYASASLQKAMHFSTSITAFDPSGIGYSSSMAAMKLYFSFFISRKISRKGVSPSPHATLSPLFFFRSFKWRFKILSLYFLINGIGDSFVPAT